MDMIEYVKDNLTPFCGDGDILRMREYISRSFLYIAKYYKNESKANISVYPVLTIPHHYDKLHIMKALISEDINDVSYDDAVVKIAELLDRTKIKAKVGPIDSELTWNGVPGAASWMVEGNWFKLVSTYNSPSQDIYTGTIPNVDYTKENYTIIMTYNGKKELVRGYCGSYYW